MGIIETCTNPYMNIQVSCIKGLGFTGTAIIMVLVLCIMIFIWCRVTWLAIKNDRPLNPSANAKVSVVDNLLKKLNNGPVDNDIEFLGCLIDLDCRLKNIELKLGTIKCDPNKGKSKTELDEIWE